MSPEGINDRSGIAEKNISKFEGIVNRKYEK